MLPSYLRSGCSDCAALCCYAFPFLVEQGYPRDKPANVCCEMLYADRRCSIYNDRNTLGFGACASYDCYGAGQWITQKFMTEKRGAEIDSPTNELLDAFRAVFAAHELLAMLWIAGKRAGSEEEHERLKEIVTSVHALRDCAAHSNVLSRVATERRRALALLRQP